MLTRDQIIKQFEKSKYKISGITFDYYRRLNLIPSPEGRKDRKGLYPDYTIRIIRDIKELQEQGFSLDKIKELTKETANYIVNARKERYNQVGQYLGLKNEGQTYSVSHLKDNSIGLDGVVTAVYPDKITWFNVSHPHPTIKFNRELKVIEQKTLTMEEYGEFISFLAVKVAKEEHRGMEDKDIFKALFVKKAA